MRFTSTLASNQRAVLFDVPARWDEDASVWRARLHAWIFEPEHSRIRHRALRALLGLRYGLRAETDEAFELFRMRSAPFFADNQRRKRVDVQLHIPGDDPLHIELGPTRPNGHVRAPVSFAGSELPPADRIQYVPIVAPHPAGGPDAHGTLHLIPPRGLSVISDIDDTCKITEVSARDRVLAHTFLLPFRSVPGMAEFYQRWHELGAALHFVSSSPWQLYEPLHTFLRESGFPKSTVHLKQIRFKDRSLLQLFAHGLTTKPRQIEPLLTAFPQRRFVLIGDSGEHDPEVYAALMRRHPDQVARIYIRNVTGARDDDARFASAFRGLPGENWQLFEHPDSLDLP